MERANARHGDGHQHAVVQRYLSLLVVQPHRTKSFALSTDPFFVEKVRDTVGLYLNPPDYALVLCGNEKSQLQSLERAQPVLPMGLGYVECVTHSYVRHGTTTLSAALDIATGEMLIHCKARHRHRDFLSFLRHTNTHVAADLDVHVVLDNDATHHHPTVRAWLAQRPRYHAHGTPTYRPWLNHFERWCGHLSQQAIKRGSFRTTRELIQRIETLVDHYKTRSRPFA